MKAVVLLLAAVSTVNAVVIKRDLQVQTAAGWSSVGCFSDDPNNRTLTNLKGVGNDVDGPSCQIKCQSLGYLYAGNEFGGQCYCDDSLHYAVQEPITDCNMTCPADTTQPCGAANRINIYQQIPSQNYTVPGWTSYGCVTDSDFARALRYRMGIDAKDVTPQTCSQACSTAGYTLSGVEFSSECFCDNYIQNSQALASDQTTCNLGCSGNPFLACGGAARMNLFYADGTTPTAQPISTAPADLPIGWQYSSCFTDAVGDRALSNYITGPPTGMTVEYCVNGCAASYFTHAGLEFGDECYCGNVTNPEQTTASESDCNMPCEGNNGETCGGKGRLNLYTFKPIPTGPVSIQYVSSHAPYSDPVTRTTVYSTAPVTAPTVSVTVFTFNAAGPPLPTNSYVTTTIYSGSTVSTSTQVVAAPGTSGTIIKTYPTCDVSCNNQGIRYAIYQNPFLDTGAPNYGNFNVSAFKTMTPEESGVASYIGFFAQQSETGPKAGDGPTYPISIYGQPAQDIGHLAVDHTFFIYAPVTGYYSFNGIYADDYTGIWALDNAVSGWTRANENIEQTYNGDYHGEPPSSFILYLTQGDYYPVRVMWGNRGGAGELNIQVTAPDGGYMLLSPQGKSEGPSAVGYTSPNLVTGACDGSTPQWPAWGSET